jgi:hypothetical protein
MAPEAKGAKFKARLEVEAGLFVDSQRGRIGPRGASWRPFRALAFVTADRGSGPDSAGTATLPRKRSDARIAVNRRARSGELDTRPEGLWFRDADAPGHERINAGRVRKKTPHPLACGEPVQARIRWRPCPHSHMGCTEENRPVSCRRSSPSRGGTFEAWSIAVEPQPPRFQVESR